MGAFHEKYYYLETWPQQLRDIELDIWRVTRYRFFGRTYYTQIFVLDITRNCWGLQPEYRSLCKI
jgi:hypothetical protein